MPCIDCPERGECTAICDRLESLLPSMHTGKFGGSKSRPASGVEAVIKLHEDGKDPKEIAYHVTYEIERIEKIIERFEMAMPGVKKLARRGYMEGR